MDELDDLPVSLNTVIKTLNYPYPVTLLKPQKRRLEHVSSGIGGSLRALSIVTVSHVFVVVNSELSIKRVIYTVHVSLSLTSTIS